MLAAISFTSFSCVLRFEFRIDFIFFVNKKPLKTYKFIYNASRLLLINFFQMWAVGTHRVCRVTVFLLFKPDTTWYQIIRAKHTTPIIWRFFFIICLRILCQSYVPQSQQYFFHSFFLDLELWNRMANNIKKNPENYRDSFILFKNRNVRVVKFSVCR